MTQLSDGSSRRRPVIIGTAMRYDRNALSPFINSWRRNAPESSVVLFASQLSRDTLDWLKDSGVEVQIRDFNPPSMRSGVRLLAQQYWLGLSFRFLRVVLAASGAAEMQSLRAARALFSIVNQRFYEYLHFLEAWGHNFSSVLLTDVRDVVFQRTPFPCDGLHVFAENETIDRSHFAKRWLFLSYSVSIRRQLGPRALLNVGTTVGDVRSMVQYLRAMCAEFDRRRAFYWGADTAMHNYVVHGGLVPAIVHTFGDGRAINLNATQSHQLLVSDGELLDGAGLPYPVVHQYDRVKGLVLKAAVL
jgi:hypothetical protein